MVEPDSPAFADAESLRNEYCVRISGQVRLRPESQWNPNMATGKIEIVADKVETLNASAPMPLMMTDEDGEEIRLKYRYLDLRRPRMQNNLRTRARMYSAIRNSLDHKGFTELENTGPDQGDTGRRTGLPGAQPCACRPVFRSAPVTTAVQTTPDDGGHGPLLPDCALLP